MSSSFESSPLQYRQDFCCMSIPLSFEFGIPMGSIMKLLKMDSLTSYFERADLLILRDPESILTEFFSQLFYIDDSRQLTVNSIVGLSLWKLSIRLCLFDDFLFWLKSIIESSLFDSSTVLYKFVNALCDFTFSSFPSYSNLL